jgi:acyl-CoA reductase-like NAD-dependent aldehyde dehydrogenase
MPAAPIWTMPWRRRKRASRSGRGPRAKRADIILKAVQLMRERVEAMAIAMTLEQGKAHRAVTPGNSTRL